LLFAELDKITKKGGHGHSELEQNFTVSQALKTGGALAQMETAVDIKIEKFSIAAKGKELFSNASLLIAQGRRCVCLFPDLSVRFER
jgi:ATP-binding cassette subfamily F protein 1